MTKPRKGTDGQSEQGTPRNRLRGVGVRLSQHSTCSAASEHRENWQKGQCMSCLLSVVVLRCPDSQPPCFRSDLCAPSPQCRQQASPCSAVQAPGGGSGGSSALPAASCPIFCTRAAPRCCAAMRVGQQQLHTQPLTGPGETSQQHALIHAQIQPCDNHEQDF